MLNESMSRDLLRPGNLPGPPLPVKIRQTPRELVFAKGDDAYTIRRAGNFGAIDLTDLGARRRACTEEVRLNRRTAPGVYVGIVPVFHDAAGYSLTRPGEIADYAVHTIRLPDAAGALERLRAGRLTHADLDAVARRLAECREGADFNPLTLRTELLADFAPFVEWRYAHQARLKGRDARDGFGDLRLERVFLMPEPLLRIDLPGDADPALTAAGPATDLRRLDRTDLAEYFLGRFAFESNDYECFPLFDGYMAMTAWERAHVARAEAADPHLDPDAARRRGLDADRLAGLAHELMRPRPPGRLIGVAGMFGSGKTAVAAEISRRTGAAPVEAHATREYLAWVPREAAVPAEIYDPAFGRRVEDEIFRRAGEVLSSGRDVVVDAPFARIEMRARARALARACDAGFLMIECRAPEGEIRRRMRERTGEDLFGRLAAAFEPIVELSREEHRVVEDPRDLAAVFSLPTSAPRA